MPFVIPRFGQGKPPQTKPKGNQMPPMVTPGANPRAPPPSQPSAVQQGTKIINAEQKSLATGITQGQTYNLPLMDINKLEFDISGTITGTTTAAVDTSLVIDHFTVADGNGNIFMNIPGGTFAYDNYARYSTPSPTTAQSNSTAAAASSLTVASLVFPNVRIPAAIGGTTGCQLTVYYNTLSTFPGATAVAVTNSISVHFGATDGYRTRYSYQTISLSSGSNHLQTNSVPQSNLISELFLRGLPTNFTAADSYGDISYLQISTNGAVVEGNLTGQQLYARDIARFGPANTLPFQATTAVLAEPSLFAMNSSSEFILDMTASGSPTFVWVWYEQVA